jgi:N-acetylglucosamine-6-phosphate deacetylase
MIAIRTARLFDGQHWQHDKVVLFEHGRIVDVAAAVPPDVAVQPLAGDLILVPGFIDLQVNGGGGVLFNDDTTVAGLSAIAAAHARAGTTALLPTLVSGTRPQQRDAVAAVAAAIGQAVPGILGLHIEGPFISLARRGIHPAENITSLTEADLAFLIEPFDGVRLLTLAPETVAAGHIRQLAAAGVVVFAGHTDASYEQARAGLDAGITGFTHLFNAMSQFGSRAPGAVGAAFAHDAAYAGIVVDGHHVHPASVRVAWSVLGPLRLLLVTDAMPTTASDCTEFVLGGKRIRLVGGRLTDDAGTIGGAHMTLAEAVRNAVRLAGIPLDEALRMATATPAAAVRLTDRGRIAPNYRADLVALDADLRVASVWQGGRRL